MIYNFHISELHFKNEEQRFVYNHTLAKTLVKIASAVSESIKHFLIISHSGFFSSYNSTILRLAITSSVHKARESYGDISFIVTCHSMGGAMASFCALDLAVNIPMSKALEMYLMSTIIRKGPSRLQSLYQG
jgi:putative lipase involved disintegration of autophagic bodies